MKMQMPLFSEIVSTGFPIDVGDNRRSTGSGTSNSFSEIPNCLYDLARSLEGVCKNIEPDFIQIGEALQTIYGDANDLTEQTLQSVGLIGTESKEGILFKVKDLVKESFWEIKNCDEGLSKNLKHVSDIIEHLERLYNFCAKFLKTVRFLTVLGLNIRIESSRSEELLDMFSAVTEEIKQVSEKISGITQVIRYDSKAERACLSSVRGEITAGLNELGWLAKDAEKAVKDAVLEIEQIAALSSKALELVVARSREISSSVSDVVVEIQFHDSMSQRIDHIANALCDVQRMLTEQTSIASETDVTMGKKWGSVHSILRLQIAQLEQITFEVDAVYEKSTNAFKKLVNEVDLLSQSLSVLASDNIENRTGQIKYSQGPLAVLQSSLRHLHGILDQGRSLFERMEKAAGRASGTADRLSAQAKQVQEISSDTHILSLNAILKAIRLGRKGKTLQVLAQEMTNLSDQSDMFVSNVGELLESITTLSRGLQCRTSSLTKGEQFKKTAGFSLDSGIQGIADSYARFTAESENIFKHSEALSNTISQTLTCLDFLPKLVLTLKEHLQRLQEISQVLICWAAQDFGDSPDEAGKTVERYTMQKERDIHEEFFEMKSDAATKAYEINPSQSADSEETDNFGDNVEFF